MKNNILDIIKSNLNNLVIDDNDSSINYNTSSISNKTDYMPDLNELFNIFLSDKTAILKYNTKNAISIILSDETEISLKDYNIQNIQENIKPAFLKITNYDLECAGGEILLNIDSENYELTNSNTPWQDTIYQIMPEKYIAHNEYEALNDLNGYENCKRLIQNYKTGMTLIVSECMSKRIFLNGHTYHRYLPALGQMNIFIKYLKLINYTLTEILKKKRIPLSLSVWTSTEGDKDLVWICNKCEIYRVHKLNILSILPFYMALKN